MAEYAAKRDPARRPSHPGAVLREDILPGLGLSKQALALRLGVSRRTLHPILAGRRPVTPPMALRLSRLLGTSPNVWLNLQQNFDLGELESRMAEDLDRNEPVEG